VRGAAESLHIHTYYKHTSRKIKIKLLLANKEKRVSTTFVQVVVQASNKNTRHQRRRRAVNPPHPTLVS